MSPNGTADPSAIRSSWLEAGLEAEVEVELEVGLEAGLNVGLEGWLEACRLEAEVVATFKATNLAESERIRSFSSSRSPIS